MKCHPDCLGGYIREQRCPNCNPKMGECRFDNAVYPNMCMAHLEETGRDQVAALCTHADAELWRRVEKLEQNLLGVNSVLGGDTVASINGEIRDQAWRIRKIAVLKDRAMCFAECYKNAWHGYQMIRETLETLGPVGAVKSEEGVAKEYGPEPIHEAQALVEAIRTLESRLAHLEEEKA